MNTVFIRVAAPFQSWGYQSNYSLRDTALEPTKSGVIGLICACLGLSREQANGRLEELNKLWMGSRTDRAGYKIHDYQTIDVSGEGVAANRGSTQGGKENEEMMRVYLSDADFLVALQGIEQSVQEVTHALQHPVFYPYLGRKGCPPGVPLYDGGGDYPDLKTALETKPWQARTTEQLPEQCRCLVEVAERGRVRRDVLQSFVPHVMKNRLVSDIFVKPGAGTPRCPIADPLYPFPRLPKSLDDKLKAQRMIFDKHLCVACQLPAREVHHVVYPATSIDDLRSVCKLCHKILTRNEYWHNLGYKRLDPLVPEIRKMIFTFRSMWLSKQE